MPKVNNPNGKKGGDKHQEKVNELFEKVNGKAYEDTGLLMKGIKEVPIFTPDGKKDSRVLDIGGFVKKTQEDKSELVKLIQVGKTDKHGNPIKREQEAINDIEYQTGKKVEFYDYEKD